MLLLLATAALAESPREIEVTYTVKFDLPSMADTACQITGICDCTMTYRGAGTLHGQSGSKLTFAGTWKQAEGRCSDQFAVWAPADGSAFHTIAMDGQTITEWIVHGKAGDTTRFTSDMKARGQFWISDMAAEVDPETKLASHFERESGAGGQIGAITTEHRLNVVLR